MVVVVLDFSTKTQNKPSKTSEEELIQILKRLAKVRGGGGVGSGERGNLPYGNACRLNNGVHDETPLILAVKCVRVHSKK